MYPLTYLRPRTLDEALGFLQQHEEARPLSGGMTLLPTLKQRLAAPSHLIDLTVLSELKGIRFENGVLHIGAATRHVEVARSPIVTGAIPALSYLAGVIADPQVRNRGTMGGSVANNDPAADYPSAVLGLGATVVTHQRRIAADDFFVGMFETALEPGELIVGFEFEAPLASAYRKYRHPASGYAQVGVFIAQRRDGVRVAVTGAGSSVFRWREAEAVLQNRCEAAALDGLKLNHAYLNEDEPELMAYRANLVEVYTRRSLAGLMPAPAAASGH
jgi:aerobic carbon-monoxide dehydrogenase medium subunit